MRFEAVGWLILLIPWLGLVIWIWRSSGEVVQVSSRFLWPSSSATSTRRRDRSPPPLWIIVSLAALFASILALSRPTVTRLTRELIVVVDPHVSMSATIQGKTIASELAERLKSQVQASPRKHQLRVEVAGTEATTTLDELPSVKWTTASTKEWIESRCRLLDRRGDWVVVLSAQQLQLPDRTIRFAPETLPNNLAIARVSASVEPVPQLMLEVTHPKNQGAFEVLVRSSSVSLRRQVEPSPNDDRTHLFIDLPSGVREWIRAELLIKDDFSCDDAAFVVRNGGWPKIEMIGSHSPSVERFAAVYEKQRPPSEDSPPVYFTVGPEMTGPTLQFANATTAIAPQPASLQLPWREIAGLQRIPVSRVSSAIPAGFQAICSAGEIPIVAVNAGPPRQVWIGFDVNSFDQAPQWVQWLDALVQFVNANEAPRWSSGTDATMPALATQVDAGGKSEHGVGIYRLPDGSRVAVNLPAMKWTAQSQGVSDLAKVLNAPLQRRTEPKADVLFGVILGLTTLAGLLMALRPRLDVRGGAT